MLANSTLSQAAAWNKAPLLYSGGALLYEGQPERSGDRVEVNL